MSSSPMDFLRRLVSQVPALGERLDCCLKDWEPEPAPLTVVFAEVGDAIAENLTALPEEVLREVFEKIEEGMRSPDLAIASAVATGLVEALVSRADKRPEFWEYFEKLLGPASAKHAVSWRNFGSAPDRRPG